MIGFFFNEIISWEMNLYIFKSDFDKFFNCTLFGQIVDNILTCLLLGHDQDIFKVTINFQIKNVFFVEIDSMDKMDFCG